MDYRNTPAGQVRVQSMWAYTGLSICTASFYMWFALVRTLRNLRDFGRATGDIQLSEIKPWTYVVGMIVGNVLIVPAFIVLGVMFVKVRRLQAAVHPEKQTAMVHIIWSMLFSGPAIQILINRTWRHYDQVPDVLAPVVPQPA